jgi:hypothetical protein
MSDDARAHDQSLLSPAMGVRATCDGDLWGGIKEVYR